MHEHNYFWQKTYDIGSQRGRYRDCPFSSLALFFFPFLGLGRIPAAMGDTSNDGASGFDGPSPFDIFKEPKLELDFPPSKAPPKDNSKPKFQPKVKPRPQARGKTQTASAQPLPAPSTQVKEKCSLPIKVESTVLPKEECSISTKIESIVPSKEESDGKSDVKVADIIMKDVPDIEEKKVDMDVKLKAEMKEEPDIEVKDDPMSPVFSEPREDKVVREIDVFFTPCIDNETKTLTSSKIPLSTGYALGILRGNKGRVQVLQFERLMRLAPVGSTEQEVLEVLQQYAHLVQGCWVAASFLRYNKAICIIRDYILLLFSKNRLVHHEQLQELKVPKEMIREVLVSLAVQRPAAGGWEFQETTDRSFIKSHHTFVKDQMQRWAEHEEGIRAEALSLKVGSKDNLESTEISLQHSSKDVTASVKGLMKPSMNGTAQGTKSVQVVDGSQSAGRGTANADFPGSTMSPETRAALPGSLRELFSKHHVCRDVVIALLRTKGPGVGLRKVDIVEASKIALKSEVSPGVYLKVSMA